MRFQGDIYAIIVSLFRLMMNTTMLIAAKLSDNFLAIFVLCMHKAHVIMRLRGFSI